jgi:hypothetical protein
MLLIKISDFNCILCLAGPEAEEGAEKRRALAPGNGALHLADGTSHTHLYPLRGG